MEESSFQCSVAAVSSDSMTKGDQVVLDYGEVVRTLLDAVFKPMLRSWMAAIFDGTKRFKLATTRQGFVRQAEY